MVTKIKTGLVKAEITLPSGISVNATLKNDDPDIIKRIAGIVAEHMQQLKRLPAAIILGLPQYEKFLAAVWDENPKQAGKCLAAFNGVPIMVTAANAFTVVARPSVAYPLYYQATRYGVYRN